jgi:lysophospholipid acyltransferase (LPLAT)-like uncharacterized protein
MPGKSQMHSPKMTGLAWRVRLFAQQRWALSPPDLSPATVAAPVHGVAGWRRAVVWPLALLVRLWGRSLRFEVAPEDLRNLTKNDEPVAFILWHNRLFMVAEIFRRYRGGRSIYSLVSASKDGAWLDAFFSQVGMLTVRGSSHRLGREAVGALISKLRTGHDIGITPDGPRGPCYAFKPGALVVTRRAGVPALLLGGEFSNAQRLASWDRFFVPWPFSRVRIRCTIIPAAELRTSALTAEELQRRLQTINPD